MAQEVYAVSVVLVCPKTAVQATEITEDTENTRRYKSFAFYPMGDMPKIIITWFPLCDLCVLCGKIFFEV